MSCFEAKTKVTYYVILQRDYESTLIDSRCIILGYPEVNDWLLSLSKKFVVKLFKKFPKRLSLVYIKVLLNAFSKTAC